MSFAAPLVLLGLVVLPVLVAGYLVQERHRTRAAAAFVSAPLTASVAPQRPGLRRHVPTAAFLLALAVLIAAAARPQHRTTVPVSAATVLLVNDISDSMAATDVSPTRLGAARQAARLFTREAPDTIAIGSIEFARHPSELVAPSTDHALTAGAVAQLRPGGGGTATGEAIELALNAIRARPKVNHRTPPGAIVLLSDGGSNVGPSPVAVARLARRAHVRIDTIAIGTAAGTIQGRLHERTTTIAVPVDPTELRATALASGGTFFRAPDQARASAIYADLAQQLGHRRVTRGLIPVFAAVGLGLLVLGAGLSLRWFGRLA